MIQYETIAVSAYSVTPDWGRPRPDTSRRKVTTNIEVGAAPDTIPELVAWAHAMLAQVPEEFRANTDFTHDRDSDYGCSTSASWWRWETDEEMGKRIAHEAGAAERYAKQQENHDRATLARLKAKYEP